MLTNVYKPRAYIRDFTVLQFVDQFYSHCNISTIKSLLILIFVHFKLTKTLLKLLISILFYLSKYHAIQIMIWQKNNLKWGCSTPNWQVNIRFNIRKVNIYVTFNSLSKNLQPGSFIRLITDHMIEQKQIWSDKICSLHHLDHSWNPPFLRGNPLSWKWA